VATSPEGAQRNALGQTTPKVQRWPRTRARSPAPSVTRTQVSPGWPAVNATTVRRDGLALGSVSVAQRQAATRTAVSS
jgi:hypothetical protein